VLIVRGRSLFVGGRRHPFVLEDGGGGHLFRTVVRGWLWWGYGCGHTMVLGGGSGRSHVRVLLFVGSGSGSFMLSCCLLAPGGHCSWVGDGHSWMGDDRSWVVDSGGGGVMVELCGSGVMVELCGSGEVVVLSVVVGPAVTSVGRHRHCPSLCPTPVALLRSAVVVVVVVGVVVHGVARH
jgi:hypothetical protein